MQLNLKKIDERIQKLQEIRRIAADPELVAMLFEFIATEDQRTEPVRTEPVRTEPVPSARADTVAAVRMDEADLISQVVKGVDAQGSGLWSRKKV